MAEITTLRVHEVIKIDSRRVCDFVTELGEEAADRVVEKAVERLAKVTADVDKAVLRLDLAKIISHTTALSRLSWQIGLVSLSNVASDLGNCALQNDLEALLVVNARLLRVRDRSLMVLKKANIVGDA